MNNKYDVWHKDIVGRFGSLLGQNMQDFYTVIEKVRERRGGGGEGRDRRGGERVISVCYDSTHLPHPFPGP